MYIVRIFTGIVVHESRQRPGTEELQLRTLVLTEHFHLALERGKFVLWWIVERPSLDGGEESAEDVGTDWAGHCPGRRAVMAELGQGVGS